MVRIYYLLVVNHTIELENVPFKYRKSVAKMLNPDDD